MKTIYPAVKKRIDQPGIFAVPASLSILLPYSLAGLRMTLQTMFSFETTLSNQADLLFLANAQIEPEGYCLSVTTERIEISYKDYAGAFYGLITLKQLSDKTKTSYPCVEIEDWPDLKFRGVMMDISRDKVPTLSTVKLVLDKMASVKLNHFELYVEGFSFEYPSFPEVSDGETPLTIKEFSEIERYAALLAIDFSGNMNGFGHMTKWLERKEYRSLAECPHGFTQWGFHFPPSTLNPLDPRSVELVHKMLDDMLPHSHSPYFNINCDEPFELSRGKSKSICEKNGLGSVYVDYVSKLVKHVNASHKTALVWGDVLLHHPEVLKDLPVGMVFLDWGYDADYPYDQHMKMLSDLNVKFIGCPGTSSWNSFASRKFDMVATVQNAAQAAKKYLGLGIMVTDWGDFGHLQYLPFSFPGLIYTGLASWGDAQTAVHDIETVLSTWVKNTGLARAIWELAGYSGLENKYQYNGTLAFCSLMFVDPSSKHPLFVKRAILKKALRQYLMTKESYDCIALLMENVLKDLDNLSLPNPEDHLLMDEILQTIRFIRIAIQTNLFINQDASINRKMTKAQLLSLLEIAIPEHGRLWHARNKTGGFDRSCTRLLVLKSLIETL
jgi:hexosaminidase